ncbi:MAG: hypothetical protein R2752_01320 [Vicinamibacterales bacterium]
MTIPRGRLLVLVALIAVAAACGRGISLEQDLEITDVSTGWYDDGIDPTTTWNHMVPSVTFKLKNNGSEGVNAVRLTLAFWVDGDDGEKDSKLVRGIGDESLAPGASTDEITVRGNVGYNVEGPRADLFARSAFRDWTVKLFASRGGALVPKGEFKIERRIIYQNAGPGQ